MSGKRNAVPVSRPSLTCQPGKMLNTWEDPINPKRQTMSLVKSTDGNEPQNCITLLCRVS